MTTEQSPEHKSVSVEQPPRETFFGPDETPKLSSLSRLKLLKPDEFEAMKNDPSHNLAGVKGEFNAAVDSLFSRLVTMVPARLESGMTEAQNALDKIQDALIVTTDNPRQLLDDHAEDLGGPTGQLFLDVYNTISESFVYYDLLQEFNTDNQ